VALQNPRGKLLRSLKESDRLKPEKDVAAELEVGRLVEADDTRI